MGGGIGSGGGGVATNALLPPPRGGIPRPRGGGGPAGRPRAPRTGERRDPRPPGVPSGMRFAFDSPPPPPLDAPRADDPRPRVPRVPLQADHYYSVIDLLHKPRRDASPQSGSSGRSQGRSSSS